MSLSRAIQSAHLPIDPDAPAPRRYLPCEVCNRNMQPDGRGYYTSACKGQCTSIATERRRADMAQRVNGGKP